MAAKKPKALVVCNSQHLDRVFKLRHCVGDVHEMARFLSSPILTVAQVVQHRLLALVHEVDDNGR